MSRASIQILYILRIEYFYNVVLLLNVVADEDGDE